jgi:hypothetical protein
MGILCLKTYAQEKIINFDTTIVIQKSGQINVTEDILYDFGTEQRHGIYRDIPLIKTNSDGEKYRMEMENVRVTDEKDNPYTFEVSSTKIKIGDADKTITGKHLYRIRYIISGALTYFDTFDEIYWNATGTEWEIPIENSTTKVVLPKTIPNVDVKAVCYTGYAGDTEQDCEITPLGNTITVVNNNTLNPNQGITVAVKFPSGHVDILEPIKVNSVTGLSNLQTLVIFILGILWYLVAPIYVASKWLKEVLFVNKNKKVVAAWFDPPKKKDRKVFSPAEVAYLATKKVQPRLLISTIISMAQRGYLKIRQEEKSTLGFKNTNFIFDNTDCKKELGELSAHEKYLYESIFSGDATVYADRLGKESFLDNYNKFNQSIDDELNKEDLIKKDMGKEKTSYLFKYAVLLFFGISSFNVLLVLATHMWSRNLGYTKKGIEKLSEALSLKNFLSSQKDQLNFQSKNQMFFEKLLPYATAFGVEKIWMNRFKDIEFKPSDWYEGDLRSTHGIMLLNRSLNSEIHRAQATSTRSTSGFSSGFSGGSSGGGGGGGGGGSW